MSAYRDHELSCPKCKAPLRTFHQRFVCDECGGMQLGVADLKRSVEELARAACELIWHDVKPGRTCPQCPATMAAASLEIHYDDERLRSQGVVERCPEHGAWFDDGQLAQVFLLVERRINRRAPLEPRDNDLKHITADSYYRWGSPKKGA